MENITLSNLKSAVKEELATVNVESNVVVAPKVKKEKKPLTEEQKVARETRGILALINKQEISDEEKEAVKKTFETLGYNFDNIQISTRTFTSDGEFVEMFKDAESYVKLASAFTTKYPKTYKQTIYQKIGKIVARNLNIFTAVKDML